MKQPLKGFIPWICIIVASTITIYVNNSFFNLDPVTLSVYTLFACWFSFIISFSDKWPLQKVPQPAQGFIFLIACIVYAILHPFIQVEILHCGPEYYWPIIANLFLGLGIVAAADNEIVKGLKQPTAILLNCLLWYVLTVILLWTVGMVPAIWFAFFVLYFFWFNRYPISELKQPSKCILAFCVMGAASLILELIFQFFGTSFVGGNLIGPTYFAHWVFWLVTTSWVFETYPVQNLKQPYKGIVGTIITSLLALISFVITNTILGLPIVNNLGYTWVFVSWVYIWPIVFGHWPARG